MPRRYRYESLKVTDEDQDTDMSGVYKTVVHHLVEQYKSSGWRIVDDLRGTGHGAYSVLMQAPEDYVYEQEQS